MQARDETSSRRANASTSDRSRRTRPPLLFVNKTSTSSSLSHSEGAERIELFTVAQRTRRVLSKRKPKEAGAAGVQDDDPAYRRQSQDRSDGQITRSRQRSPLVTPNQILLASPHVAMANRAQLTAHFLESYYPPGMPRRAQVVDKLCQWIQPTKGAVARAAADSMILLHAAQASRNRALRHEGALIYQTALRLLRKGLQNADHTHDDSILGAVEVMGVVETMLSERCRKDYEEISRTHLRGLYALFLSRGPSIVQSPISSDILLNRLHEPLMVSLLARKACVFGSLEWQAAFESIDGKETGRMYRLTSLGCCIPGALEKADAITSGPHSDYQEYVELLNELIALETRMTRWLSLRIRNRFAGKESEHTQTVCSRSYIAALTSINYFGLLLILRKTMLDVLVSLETTHPLLPYSRLSSADMWTECDKTADLFCQKACDRLDTLPTAQSRVAKQGMIIFLTLAVLPWYAQSDNFGKAAWCRGLIENFHHEHQDLDKVEDVDDAWTTNLYIGWVNMVF